MPICAKVVQSNGEQLLALDPAQTDFSTCTYVVESGDEVASSFFRMSSEDGFIFSAGLIACWLTAFGIKSIISIIRGSTNE
jgi:hypothetical protein